MSVSVEVRGVTELAGRFEKLPEATRNNLRVFMARFTLQLRDQVKANIADRFKSTGPLYQGVQSQLEEDTAGISGRVLVEAVPYAAIQEYGGQTSPHEIAPVKAQALAFMASGKLGFSSGGGTNALVFAKHVNHPGSRIPERSYARLALTQMRGAFDDGIRAATADAVAQAGFAVAAE
jgi:phage gpG-like protein